MTSAIHSLIAKRIHEEGHKLRQEKIDPWYSMTAGQPFEITNFYGRTISYQGVEFTGNPRHVFWERYIEPFLEDIIERVITETAQDAIDCHINLHPALHDAERHLKSLVHTTYQRMAEVDQRLRGKGRPSDIPPRPVDKEISRMERYIEQRISVELAAPRKARGLEGFFRSNQFLFWLLAILVTIALATIAL